MKLLEHVLDLPACQVDHDLPYLPLPNRVEIVLTEVVAPADLTRTAFVLPYLEDGTLVMAMNRRRGLEIPGGHIDSGESAVDAACREAMEETGCVVDEPVAIGFLRMISGGTVPQDWAYPHPVGFQQFYAARVLRRLVHVDNDECIQPVLVSVDEATNPDGPLGASQRVMHEAAVLRMAISVTPPESGF